MLRSLRKFFSGAPLRTPDSYSSYCLHEMMLCKTITTENTSPMVLQASTYYTVFIDIISCFLKVGFNPVNILKGAFANYVI